VVKVMDTRVGAPALHVTPVHAALHGSLPDTQLDREEGQVTAEARRSYSASAVLGGGGGGVGGEGGGGGGDGHALPRAVPELCTKLLVQLPG
jgi:hypothetical protein